MRQSSLDILKRLHGKSGEDYAAAIEASQPKFARLVDDFVLDKVWNSRVLPDREKVLITISAEIGQGRWDQVELQMRSFLHIGGSMEELVGVLIHLTVYCGFPVAVSGFQVLEKIKGESDSI